MEDPKEWLPGVPPGLRRDKAAFVRFLLKRLIPDLEESGFSGTAQDFKTAVAFIRDPESQGAGDFVAYLRETLIPDLRDSGYEHTAEDFETAADFIED